MFFDRVANIWRLQTDSDNTSKEAYVAYAPLQDVAINIQPSSPEDTVVAGGVFGQSYIAFTTYSGILEGDKVVVEQTGEVLMVKGKTNWMSPDGIPHIELLLTEFETSE